MESTNQRLVEGLDTLFQPQSNPFGPESMIIRPYNTSANTEAWDSMVRDPHDPLPRQVCLLYTSPSPRD